MTIDISEQQLRASPGDIGTTGRDIRITPGRNALVAGTVILTLDGALPVEFIAPGDRVITRDSGVAVVQALLRGRDVRRCVSVRAGSLGNARPDRDVILTATQEVLIRDWRAAALFGKTPALVAAERLVDGAFVRDIGACDMETIAVIFDAPHIVYADGLEVASAVWHTDT
ncbi:Hint domain-containing protein [Tropicibacter sp. S64]|uniref:Hint domain-containing protein n=1 Tax=Tropicibacter sp. S64 TaxID=3415122 RepID=UPI003C7E5CEE